MPDNSIAMAQTQQTKPPETISIGVLYPGNRVSKILRPLEHSRLDVDVEPSDAHERDFVIADNADTDLGKEVLRKPFTNAELIYRMRGDVYHELDLWGMNPVKEWIAKNVVLEHVDGVIAVSNRLANNFKAKNPKPVIGSAELVKEVEKWPTVNHQDDELRIVTLTNANYLRKVEPLIRRFESIESVLEETGGYWHLCGKGDFEDKLEVATRGYSRIQYSGYVDPKEELSQANLMVHFSRLDGQPNSVLEGLASGLPVITNDFAAFRQFDGPVNIAYTESRLQELLYTYTDPQKRAERKTTGMDYIANNHSLDAVAQAYERYFSTYYE